MKRTILIGAMVLGFIFVANIVFGDFYVIPTRPKIAGTEITSLPYKISSPGFYYITRDLTSTGAGIVVEADNVTIDLMGFSLIGLPGTGKGSSTGNGIFMSGRANVEVRNGTVRDFGLSGIYEDTVVKGMNHRIISVRSNGNGGAGIYIEGQNHLIKDCTASNNGDVGICAEYGSRVTGNTAYKNQHDGVKVCHYCTVTGNTAYENGGDGISTSYGCTVRGNTASQNQEDGIYVVGNSTVTGNTVYSNTNDGLYVDHNCTVRGNTACYNGNYGIYLGGSCLVHANTATNNTTANIYCLNGNCHLRDNYAP